MGENKNPNTAGTLAFEIASIVENNQTAINGSGTASNPEHETSLIRTLLFTTRYPVSPRLSLLMSLPYKDIHAPKDAGGLADKHIERSYSGPGDLMMLANYRLNSPAKATDATFGALMGVRFPTGNAEANHVWIAADGTRIITRDPVLQPGFGTVDPLLGFQWSKPQPRGRSLYLGALYRPTVMTNCCGYRFASEFQFNTGMSLPLGRKLTFSPQLFGQFAGHDYDSMPLPDHAAGRVANTGGTWLYFLPNVRYGSFEFNLQIPVYRRTNGSILNPNLVFGVRTNFNLPVTREARVRKTMPGDFKVISRGERVDLQAHAVPGKITLFQFASDTCDSCKALTPMLRIILAQRPDIALREVNVTWPNAPASEQYGVTGTPSFLIVGKNGARMSDVPTDFEHVQAWLEKQTDADNTELAKSVSVISHGEEVRLKDHLVAKKVTVIQFFTPTCDSCRSVASGLRYTVEREAGLALKRIDVSDDQSPVVAQHHVEVTPMFIVYSTTGRLVGRLVGTDFVQLLRLIEEAKRS